MLEQTELQFIEDKQGRSCPICGGEVAGKASKVYCSEKCKNSAWREANPERGKELNKEWRKANSEKVKAENKKWRKANPEKCKKALRKWQKANPEKCKEYCHRRRARLKGNGIEDTSDFRARMTHPLVRQVCFYCGKDCTSSGDWHWDHRIPISAGGPDAEWNLVIACVSCNLKKGSKYPKTLFAEEIFNEP